MIHVEIVSHLSSLIDSPASDILNSITMQHVLNQLALRMGEVALALTPGDLQLARSEVLAAINHHLDIRDYIDMGLDAWMISRHL